MVLEKSGKKVTTSTAKETGNGSPTTAEEKKETAKRQTARRPAFLVSPPLPLSPPLYLVMEATMAFGNTVSNGIYIYVLETNNYRELRKMLF